MDILSLKMTTVSNEINFLNLIAKISKIYYKALKKTKEK